MNIELRKRIKSFLWRLGMVLLITAVDFMAANIGIFDLPPGAVVVVGLIAGEVSKWLNKSYTQ